MGGVERLPVPCMDARRLARASLPSGKQGRVRSCIRRFDAAPTRPLGLMKSADRPPIKASRFAALGTGRVLSIPGATGLPSGHDHPYASSNLRASSCRGRHLFSEWPFLDENCPDDPGCLVGHRHGRNFPWVSTDVQNWTLLLPHWRMLPGFAVSPAERIVPEVHRRAPRASRSALTSDGAARVGGACGPSGGEPRRIKPPAVPQRSRSPMRSEGQH